MLKNISPIIVIKKIVNICRICRICRILTKSRQNLENLDSIIAIDFFKRGWQDVTLCIDFQNLMFQKSLKLRESLADPNPRWPVDWGDRLIGDLFYENHSKTQITSSFVIQACLEPIFKIVHCSEPPASGTATTFVPTRSSLCRFTRCA